MKIFTRYERTRFPTDILTPSRTHGEFKDECDVNNIINGFERNGYLVDPSLPITRTPSFGDFTVIPTFQEAQNALIEANDAFASLPSSIRKKFDNEPTALIAWLNDENNREEAIALGLIEKVVEVKKDPVEVKIVADNQIKTE